MKQTLIRPKLEGDGFNTTLDSLVRNSGTLDSILYSEVSKKDEIRGYDLNLINLVTDEHKIISRENGWIASAVPFGDGKILYGGDFTRGRRGRRALALIDPRTKKSKVVSRENGSILSAVPFGDGRILYGGDFTKDGENGNALTLIDPRTKKYRVVSRENGSILSAVPFKN